MRGFETGAQVHYPIATLPTLCSTLLLHLGGFIATARFMIAAAHLWSRQAVAATLATIDDRSRHFLLRFEYAIRMPCSLNETILIFTLRCRCLLPPLLLLLGITIYAARQQTGTGAQIRSHWHAGTYVLKGQAYVRWGIISAQLSEYWQLS